MKRYLEDLSVGDKFETATYTLNEKEMLEFAHQFDAQPMHIDRAAAERGPFKGLIASGWHTAAIVMKLTAEARFLGDTPVLGLGVEGLEWPKPVRAGDTLRVVTEVTKVRPSKSNPGFGIVGFASTGFNQNGEVVFVARPNVWVPRRPQNETSFPVTGTTQ
jgi:acyl dehydratase